MVIEKLNGKRAGMGQIEDIPAIREGALFTNKDELLSKSDGRLEITIESGRFGHQES